MMKTSLGLTPWQKKQAALLYYFASLDYLKGLKERVDAIRAFAEGILDENRAEGRDNILRSSQWGDRNTGENWANNAWPFLADFQLSLTHDISDRAFQKYSVTGANQCGRGMAEFSMQWSTPAEQERFDEMFGEISKYAWYIDQTMNRTGHANKWHDFGLTMAWQEHADHFPLLPKFRVLENVTAESGHVPPRTGVYVSIDDPDATLQFAWNGSANVRLLDCATLNDLGKAALGAVGRSQLWVNGKAMLDFVRANLSRPELLNDPFFEDSQTTDLAPTLVAGNAFASHPSGWYFVELLNDEFEQIDIEIEQNNQGNSRFESGTFCPKEGIYFTPARIDSRRRFETGETFPEVGSPYGKTLWQWDEKQK